MFDLRVHLKPRQAAVEHALAQAMQVPGVPPVLAEAMAYSLLAPGKRLRPLLAILACEACGGTIEQALPAACAVEMIHAYSLIHDDLPAMDDDDLRRGLPTCHVKFGEALAILAGDALQALAFETLCMGYGPQATTVMMVQNLARAAGGSLGMVGGQVLDLQADGRVPGGGSQSDERTLEAIHHSKTGALIVASLLLGKYAAYAKNDTDFEERKELIDYAFAFGLLFQVTDDLLDVESTTEATGKRVNKDADRGKLTYPGLLGVDASRAKAKELADVAIRAANAFGVRGEPLAALAHYVLERDR